MKTFSLYLVWLSAFLSVALLGHSMPLGAGVVVVFLAALPIWVAYAYASSIKRQHNLNQVFVPRWWHRLFEGHLLRVPVLLVVSLWFGVEVLADILDSPGDAVVWLVIAAALGVALSRYFQERLTNYKPYYRVHMALRFAVPLTGLLAGLGWVLSHSGSPEDAAARYAGTSELLKEIVATGGLWNLLQDELAAYLPAWVTALLRFVSAAGYYSLVALAGGGLSLLASGEWRRVFVFGAELPPAVPRSGLFMTSLLLTVGFAIVAFGAAQTEQYLQATLFHPDSNADLGTPTLPTRPSEVREIVEREGVGGLVCRVGTIKALEVLDREFAAVVTQNAGLIEQRTDLVFDGMRARVPEFLDWYYSLTADYLRTGHVLIGDGSNYLNKQLLERLAPQGTSDSIQSIYGDLTRNLLDYNAKRLAILSACGPDEVPSDPTQLKITAQYDPSKVLSAITRLNELLASGSHFELRAGGSTLVAAAAGTVLAKVGVKSTFKLAAELLLKVAGKKATTVLGGVLAGAGIGGAAGSTVPGAGTGVGAVVGGIVGGAAIMVGVDFLALKLDEKVNQDDFKAELLAAIDDAQREFKAALLGQ